ncbi:molecular chaperone HtpG [Salidesulfovibrio brasiliensis]|uniref:molecular chaperone HtpG n=1 Tax=Salidesulfovibrio brasiliensis TaxID=221711 RepID=UPI0006D0EAEC|nr:molecular chaperone HtpG [Salidesulfovibrio brasiliensis]
MGRKTTHKFKAEINQLLDILVHSLYTNKEIFLRELVSNASDALDKYRFLTQSGQVEADETPLEIRVTTDSDAGTVTVTDTGIGMTRDEVMKNIGTIAHSGTAEITRLAQEGKESLDALIGRFGVGFYSAYMVADEVTVTTRSADPEAKPVEWTSDGRNDYKLRELDEDLPRGTTVTLKLKEDLASQFANDAHLEAVVKKHSNFISHPVFVGDTRVNTVPALWREPKFQIKPEQYKEFYTFLTHDDADPLETIHVSVDAPVQYNALLFIPPKDDDMFGFSQDNRGLDLYVRRVLIQHQNKDLLPEYLAFAKGVVDTEDLPLNISRETLQDNVLIRKISSNLVKQVYTALEKMADDKEKYAKFWKEHGKLFRAGYMDFIHKDRFVELLRFNSSDCEDAEGLVSLAEYAARLKEGQKEIYYAYGPSREALSLSPHLEIFRKKNVEVLYLYEPIDEFVMDAIREYGDYKLVAAEHADLSNIEGGEENTDKPEELAEEQKATLDSLLERIKEVLGDAVTEVRVTTRLSDSPACLANPDGAMTSSMDKVMRSIHKDTSIPTKVMEINPDHPLTRNLIDIFETDQNDPFVEQAARQLYESALLLEGYLDDPHALVGRIQSLLTQASGWYKGAK